MPQELYHDLIGRLAALRQRRESVALVRGLSLGLSLAFLVALLSLGVEALWHLSIVGRTWLFWSALTIAAAGSLGLMIPALLVRLGLRKRSSDDELSLEVGRHFPAVSDRLVNSLQLVRPLYTSNGSTLAQNPAAIGGSAAFAAAAFANIYQQVRELDFLSIIDERPARRALLMLALTLLAGLASFGAAPETMTGAASRLVHFRTFFQKPAPFTFVVSPGNARVMRGDSVRITVTTRGEQLSQIKLHYREEGQKEFDIATLAAQPLDSTFTRQGYHEGFIYVLHTQHPTEYFAEAREIESDHFRVSVLDHPIIRSLGVTLEPPAYTREKPTKQSENIGDITGIAGTRGVFRIVASSPLLSATLVFRPSSVAPATSGQNASAPSGTAPNGDTTKREALPEMRFGLSVTDSIATGAVTFLRSGVYHIDLIDRDSVRSEHPIEYTVTVTRDEPPQITIIQPESRADLPNDMRLDILARIHDDFGFRGVRLGYKITRSKYLRPDTGYKWLPVPLETYNAQDLEVPYIWNLTPLGIGPEDELAYVLEVTDNDAVTGPKSARTAEYSVRVPSVAEIFKKADEDANKAQRDMNAVRQEAEEVQKKVNEALAEMQQMKSSDIARSSQDFTKQKDVQQMLQKQKTLNDRIDQIAKDLKQMTQSMEQQNALTPETMQKYQELQELFKQIDSPELKKAMEELQRAMQQNVDPKKLQDAMQNMKQSEEAFRKSIERTANILKKIQAEQKVDALMKSASALAKQEQKTADEMNSKLDAGKKMSTEERAAEERRQQDAQKELDRMREELKALLEQMKKLPEKMQAPEEATAAAEALSDPSTDKDMQDAADAAQAGDEQKAAQKSRSASAKMRNAQHKLADLKRKLSENDRQRNMREMRQVQQELNKLSLDEESIKNRTREAMQNSNVFRDLAREQSSKKDELGKTASKAMQLAQRSTAITPEMGSEMGKAFANMDKAEDAMTDRNPSAAEQSSQAAMSALNKATQQMQNALQKMAQSGQSGQSGGQGGEGEEGSSGGGNEGDDGSTPGGSSPGGAGAMQQFINQINQMAKQQQALNNAMQGMAQGQSGSGGGQSAEKEMMRRQAEISKLATQQEAMKKSLEQMAEEQRSAKSGMHQAIDDLRRIAEDMQQSIGDMKSSGVRPETIQRQERILSRLLQARRSVHERDKDLDRESKPGENVIRESPRDLRLDSPQAQGALQDELLRTRETGFTRDYNALIRKYLESLGKK